MYYIFIIFSLLFPSLASAISLTVPPTDGNKDIILTGPTEIESQSDLITGYIQLINKYLWFFMIIVLFALVVWIGFKLMTNEAGSDEAKNILKKGLTSAGAGIMIILLSYTIVRLVINLL